MKIYNFIHRFSHVSDEKSLVYDVDKYSKKDKCETPKVSIIIPLYNAEKYIQRTLHYILNQTLEEIEVIIINDGSTDNSMSYVKELSKIDKRITILEQENKLQGAARNKGMSIAKGEYVGFCDADDYVDYDYYEKLYMAAKNNDADIALAENVRISADKYKRRLNISKEEVFSEIIDKLNACNQHKNECPTNKIYRLSYLKEFEINYPEGVYCEDKLFSIKSVYYANKIVTVPNIHYYYWENLNSTVNSKKTKKHINDRKVAKQSVLEFVKEKNIPVEDWYFKAEKKRIGTYRLPLFIIYESTESEKGYLFGVICLYVRKTKK